MLLFDFLNAGGLLQLYFLFKMSQLKKIFLMSKNLYVN